MSDLPTERFSDRVAAYVRYRPTYPAHAINWLLSEAGLVTPSDIADLGSGTGIFVKPLLEQGHRVYAVEPNTPMRQAAEESLNTYPGFTSINGTAEQSTLDDSSVDLVTAAQAYHWFDPVRVRAECKRILRPGGQAALIWNDRQTTGSDFAEQYQQFLLNHAYEPDKVDHQRVSQVDLGPFYPNGWSSCRFTNAQLLDRDGFIGRIVSSSYMPNTEQPGYQAMREAADAVFEKFASDDQVQIDYQTVVMIGSVN